MHVTTTDRCLTTVIVFSNHSACRYDHSVELHGSSNIFTCQYWCMHGVGQMGELGYKT